MSKETFQSLAQNTIQGYGVRPWHFREGVSPEPYADAVPEQVVADLFPRIIEVPVAHQTPVVMDENGVSGGEWVTSPDHKSLLRDDTNAMLAIVGESYTPHQYEETLLGMGLPIASAGLLKEGRHAWVQYGTADTVVTQDNVEFVTKLLAVTSADASLSTQFRYVTTLAVCDNTLSMALQEGSDTAMKVRHTRFSVARVEQVRKAFGLIGDVAEIVESNVTEQIQTTVTDAQIALLLDTMLPATAAGSEVTGRAKTIASNKRDAIYGRLNGMWSDYRNTKFGVLQAIDTATRWDFRTTDAEKALTKTIAGDFDTAYAQGAASLDLVLSV